MIPIPTCPGGYKVIYPDPPWNYRNKRTRSAAEDNYRTMTIEDLRNLPIADLAAPDCALFLWTTSPFMEVAIALGKSWGFEYKTIAFLWAKRNKKKNTPFFGMGNYTRANVEACLLFTRGSPKRASASVQQFVWSPKRRHSEKPDEVRTRIVKLMGDVPRIELFARHETPGWATWGNEILQ